MVEPSSRPPLVADASAAIAMARSEATAPAIARLLAAHRSAGGRLLVPDHFWLEVANVLGGPSRHAPSEVVAAIQDLDELGIESIRVERPLLLLALDLQARFGLSAYDAIYLALAETEDARLLTLDRRLADAAGDRAVRIEGVHPHRLAEEHAMYGAEPIDWARFGPYLARLRAEARAEARSAAR